MVRNMLDTSWIKSLRFLPDWDCGLEASPVELSDVCPGLVIRAGFDLVGLEEMNMGSKSGSEK